MWNLPTFFKSLQDRHPLVWWVLGGAVLIIDGIGRIDIVIRIFRSVASMVWPNHILAVIGGIFIAIGFVQRFAPKSQTARQSAITLYSVKQRLRVDHLVVQACFVAQDCRLYPGAGYEVALVNLLNDPQATDSTQLYSLEAKITYYHSKGDAYLTVERGVWKGTSGPTTIPVGHSESLVLALVGSDTKPFTIDQTWDSNLRDWHAFRANLRDGINTAAVLLTYKILPERSEILEFKFRLTFDKNLRLESIKE